MSESTKSMSSSSTEVDENERPNTDNLMIGPTSDAQHISLRKVPTHHRHRVITGSLRRRKSKKWVAFTPTLRTINEEPLESVAPKHELTIYNHPERDRVRKVHPSYIHSSRMRRQNRTLRFLNRTNISDENVLSSVAFDARDIDSVDSMPENSMHLYTFDEVPRIVGRGDQLPICDPDLESEDEESTCFSCREVIVGILIILCFFLGMYALTMLT